jgi:alpha-tubulin suppressor-like RCC1 family protein
MEPFDVGGQGSYGQLGYGNEDDFGDDEPPSSAGDVDIGGPVIAIGAAMHRACAILQGGGVRCWGFGGSIVIQELGGPLGYGNLEDVGDDETPASMGDIDIGGAAIALAVGAQHTCVVIDGGSVRCWGYANNGYDLYPGRLGYGNIQHIGDNETPASAGDVDIGGIAVGITAGVRHTCALLDDGAVRCWGWGGMGTLGYGNTANIGDNEAPASAGDVPLGGVAVAIDAGGHHTCALLEGGNVRCWGEGSDGQIGYGTQADVGDDETPADAGDVMVGGVVVEISAGQYHTCARLEGDAVRCWGQGILAQLGYANTNDIGDDEVPAAAGDVMYQ